MLLVVYFMTTRVFRRQFSEMTELVNTLAFFARLNGSNRGSENSRRRCERDYQHQKNSIAEMKDAEIERSNKLLSLISYDQESGFIKNMAIIESNNNQYLAVGIIKLCGLEAVEAVFGVDERNKNRQEIVSANCREICAMLRYRDIQCRSLFTSVSGKCTDIYP